MHVAASADSLADRHQDRYIMMPVATISRVTSDRLYRWLMAGQMTHGLSTRHREGRRGKWGTRLSGHYGDLAGGCGAASADRCGRGGGRRAATGRWQPRSVP